MEGNSSAAPAAGKGGVSKRVVAVVVVAVLLVAAVGAALLLVSNNNSTTTKADNWLDQGFNLEIFYNSGSTARATECQLIKAGVEALNPGKIHITVTPLEWSTYLDYRSTHKMPAMFLGWAPDFADPDDYAPPFYQSMGTYAHMIAYSNSTVDALVSSAATELNQTQRAADYNTIGWNMYNESAYVLTAQFTSFTCQWNYVQGNVINPMYSLYYYYPITKNTTTNADTLKVGEAQANPSNFDPAVDYETVGGGILQNVYETLFFYNATSGSTDPVPLLAAQMPTVANGGISADGKTYNITLRSDVKFSDGTPMTSADVVYTFERGLMLNDPEGPFWMYGTPLFGADEYGSYSGGTYNTTTNAFVPGIPLANITKHVWAPDPTHVVFNLSAPYPPFLSALAFNGASIVSKAYVEANGGIGAQGYNYMLTHAMGTGPFTLKEYVSLDHILMERNDNYWRTPATLKDVYYVMYPDVNSRILALTSGQVDIAGIPPAQKESVNQTGITFMYTPSYNVEFMGLNEKINVTGADPSKTNVPSNFFADVNVRKAFAYAFDYQTWKTSQAGTVVLPNSVIPIGMFGYSSTIPSYSYNLTLAAQYLKAAKTPWATSSHEGMNVLQEISEAAVKLEQ